RGAPLFTRLDPGRHRPYVPTILHQPDRFLEVKRIHERLVALNVHDKWESAIANPPGDLRDTVRARRVGLRRHLNRSTDRASVFCYLVAVGGNDDAVEERKRHDAPPDPLDEG